MKSLESQAKQILEQAEKRGLSTNYFFRTTFERYQTQLQILKDLEVAIQEHGTTVTKSYVKDRENLVANPAITEYNRTATAANGTVKCLIDILKSFTEEQKSGMMEILDSLKE